MGYSISWIAVRGTPVEVIHERLGISATDDEEDLPEASCTAASLPNGWHVVFYNKGCDAVDHYAAKLVASGVEAIACAVEEHVMFSSTTAWRNGKTVWIVQHNPDRGIPDLTTAGEVPAELQAIVERLRAEQVAAGGEASEVDFMFEAPVDLAEAVVGFRHDRDPDSDDGTPWKICEILRPAPGPAHMAGAGKFGCFGIVLALTALAILAGSWILWSPTILQPARGVHLGDETPRQGWAAQPEDTGSAHVPVRPSSHDPVRGRIVAEVDVHAPSCCHCRATGISLRPREGKRNYAESIHQDLRVTDERTRFRAGCPDVRGGWLYPHP